MMAALLGILAAIAGVAGSADLAVGAVGLLVSALFIVMIDVRRRQGILSVELRRLRDLPDQINQSVSGTVEPLSRTIDGAIRRLDESGAGLIAGFAQERLAAAERHVGLLNELSSLKDDMSAKIDKAEESGRRRETTLRAHVDRLGYEPVRQFQALLQLVDRVETRAPLPPPGGWAMEPSTLLRLVSLVENTRPAVVVECGSGASTVWLAYAVQAAGPGRVIALEHDERFAAQTRQWLQEHGLGDIAEVRVAPLVDLKLGTETFTWYQRDVLEDLKDIELLVVDGPPRASGPNARYPAIPMLGGSLAPGARIVIDDVDRADEQEAVDAWVAELPGLERDGEPIDRAATLVYRPV